MQGVDQARDEFLVSRMISGAKEEASCRLDLLSKEQTQAQTFVVRAGWAAIRIVGRRGFGRRDRIGGAKEEASCRLDLLSKEQVPTRVSG